MAAGRSYSTMECDIIHVYDKLMLNDKAALSVIVEFFRLPKLLHLHRNVFWSDRLEICFSFEHLQGWANHAASDRGESRCFLCDLDLVASVSNRLSF